MNKRRSSNKVQRYCWEDAVIEAEAAGELSKGAVNMALRLARVIHWEPKGKPSGLYWKNELAAEVVSTSRSTLFRNIKELKAKGFFKEKAGNLLPCIPANVGDVNSAYNLRLDTLKVKHQSQSDTEESHNDTSKSHNDTEKSQSDNPYSEDTSTDDLNSDDVNTDSNAVADAPADKPEESNTKETSSDELPPPFGSHIGVPLDSEKASCSSEGSAQSHNETRLTLRQKAALKERPLVQVIDDSDGWI